MKKVKEVREVKGVEVGIENAVEDNLGMATVNEVQISLETLIRNDKTPQ